jgi:hypothetical protein
MLILIAGPYRSGTNDDPVKMAENLARLAEPSYQLFEAGHLPMIGEWVALPVRHAAGGKSVGDGDLPSDRRSAAAVLRGSSAASRRKQGCRQRCPHRP